MLEERTPEEVPEEPGFQNPAVEPFYITGGTLPLDADSYVVRRADTQLLDGLMRGEFCYVLNTRQMGKSSLMVRAARRLREEGCQVALLDLTAIGQNLTVEQWYYGLLTRTAAQTRTTGPMLAFWKANRELGPMQRFLEAIRYVLLEPDSGIEGISDTTTSPVKQTVPTAVPAPPLPPRGGTNRAGGCDRLIIFVDEIDAVRSLPFSVDEFFAGIRECYNRRPQDPVFERLTFCLLGVAAPSDLVQDTRISPFNIGTRIELQDFTPGEAARLAKGLLPNRGIDDSVLSSQVARRVLERVLYWTGGHPYITQQLCRAVARHSVVRGKAIAENLLGAATISHHVDHRCRELFLTKRAQEADDNLTFVRNRLLNSEADTSALLDLYRAVRRNRHGIKNDAANPLCSLLQLSGVAAVSHERLLCRNRIYEQVFNGAWIDEHLPGAELRRQRTAFRRGVWRTAVVSSGVSLCFLALAAFAVDRAGLARRERARALAGEATARALLSKTYFELGIRLMDAGDASGALAPLVEAMRLDADNPDHTAQHRLRIGTTLALCPQIDHLWSAEKPLKWATFSPDKKQITAVGEDGRIYLWNTDSTVDAATTERPEELSTNPNGDGIRAPINYAAFSPDGTRLVTCHDDACARVWDVKERKLLYSLPQFPQNDGNRRVLKASWGGDGQHLVLIGGAHYEVWTIPSYPVSLGSDQTLPSSWRIKADLWKSVIFTDVAYSPTEPQFALIASNNLGWQIKALTRSLEPAQSLTLKVFGSCYGGKHISYNRDGSLLLVAGEFTAPPHPAVRGVVLFDGRVRGKGVDRQRSPLMNTGAMPLYAAFSPDKSQKRIATVSSDSTVQIWDASSGKPLTPVMRHETGSVTEIEFSPDGTRVVTAGLDGTARVWDAATGEPVCAPMHHAGAVLTARFGKDRDHILTASRDGTVRLWSLPPTPHSLFDAPRRLAGLTQPTGDLTQALHQQNANNSVNIIDFATGRILLPLQGKQVYGNLWARSVTSKRHILFGPPFPSEKPWDVGAKFAVWDQQTTRLLTPFLQANSVFLNHQGNILMLTNRTGTHKGTHLLRIGTDYKPSPFLDCPNLVVPYSTHTAFTPDDCAFLAVEGTNTTGRRIRLYDTQNGAPRTPPMILNASLQDWAFSPDGRYLFTWTEDPQSGGVVQAWNTSDGTPAASAYPLTNLVGDVLDDVLGDVLWMRFWVDRSGLRFSADGSMAVTRSAGSIYFWRLNGAKHLQPQQIPLPQTQCVVFSPDGRWLATVGQSQWLWNTHTSQVTPVPLAANSGLKIRYADFSPDSRRVVAVYEDGTTTIYDTQTGQPVSPSLPFSGTLYAAFSPDGKLAATGGAEGKARVWNVATGEPLTPILHLPPSNDLPLKVTFCRFTPDGKHLIVSSIKYTIWGDTCVWDLQPSSLSTERLRAQSMLLSGHQMDSQKGTILASPEATRAAWKVVQKVSGAR